MLRKGVIEAWLRLSGSDTMEDCKTSNMVPQEYSFGYGSIRLHNESRE